MSSPAKHLSVERSGYQVIVISPYVNRFMPLGGQLSHYYSGNNQTFGHPEIFPSTRVNLHDVTPMADLVVKLHVGEYYHLKLSNHTRRKCRALVVINGKVKAKSYLSANQYVIIPQLVFQGEPVEIAIHFQPEKLDIGSQFMYPTTPVPPSQIETNKETIIKVKLIQLEIDQSGSTSCVENPMDFRC
jgi:hypothetical protein